MAAHGIGAYEITEPLQTPYFTGVLHFSGCWTRTNDPLNRTLQDRANTPFSYKAPSHASQVSPISHLLAAQWLHKEVHGRSWALGCDHFILSKDFGRNTERHALSYFFL